ncbi:putative glutathione S-transferase [Cinnamomum micranthum f. kanehirae]|uniref:glutathione transferase n=1 Tax=Cinnamomum micranthum f. kanehirae TaxID=337451 RepID=A0A3S3P0L6_9MAGN|nr:putative glutathione S-transferase [Cinnamomum micranthum f. kanehirae]
MAEEVVVLGMWASPFVMRVTIALLEKGVEYEYKEEDQPVHKKVPVLIHNGRPICESLIIVQYIEETWTKRSPLLPGDPYERANARFWADYIDKRNKGEAREKAKKEFIDCLKALGQKRYFGGESFRYVDLAFIPFACWFYAYEKHGNFSVEEKCPKLMAWVRRCTKRKTMAKVL